MHKRKEEPKTRWSAKPAPGKVETKPKEATGKGKSSGQKSTTKGVKGSKGKKKGLTKKLKKIYPQTTEKLRQKSPASDEAGEKEASLINTVYHVLLVVPVSLLLVQCLSTVL